MSGGKTPTACQCTPHFSSPRPLHPTLPPSGFVKKKVNLCSRVIERAKQQAAKIGNTLLKQLERL